MADLNNCTEEKELNQALKHERLPPTEEDIRVGIADQLSVNQGFGKETHISNIDDSYLWS